MSTLDPRAALEAVIEQADADGEIVNVSILVLHKDDTLVAYSCADNTGQVVSMILTDGGKAIASGVADGSLGAVVMEPGL